MTHSSDSTTQARQASDPAVQALVRIVGLLAIIVLIAIGYLMVQKSNAARDHGVKCAVAQSQSYGYVPRDCR